MAAKLTKRPKLNSQIARIFHHPATQGVIGGVVLVSALVSLLNEVDECAAQTRLVLNLSGEASLVLLAFAFVISVLLTLDPFVDGLELVEDALEGVKARRMSRFHHKLQAFICSPTFHLILGALIITGGIVEAILEFTEPGGKISFWSLGMVYFGLHTTCNILARIKRSLSLAEESLNREPVILHLTAKISRFLSRPYVSSSLAVVILISGLAGSVLNHWILGTEMEAAGGLEPSSAGISVFAMNTFFHNILIIKDAEQVIDDEVTAVLDTEPHTAGASAGEG